jgi:hypothetical protein
VFAAFLSVPAGFVLGSLAPGVDSEVLGPLRVGPLLHIFAVMTRAVLFMTHRVVFRPDHRHALDGRHYSSSSRSWPVP